MSPTQRRSPSRGFEVCVTLFLAFALHATLHAQNNCPVEVKLLLSPRETQAAISSFNATKETTGHVYFFDTSALDLLSQGVIVRLRRGAANDLTVKMRLPGIEPFVPSEVGKDSKCEIDLTGGGTAPSYSVMSRYAGVQLPETGTDILKLLSAGQERLLKRAHVSIDWTRVKRIADIDSKDWQTKAQPRFNKLTLELWEWPAGRILELSTKVGPDAGPSTYTELQQLVNAKGLSLSANQRAKTGMVLELLTHPPAH